MNTKILTITTFVFLSLQYPSWNIAAQQQDSNAWAGVLLSERMAWDLPLPPSLEVMKQSKHSRLGLGKSIIQTPIQVHDNVYNHGLGTHASSEVMVRLPKPGSIFEGEVGIDNNSETKGMFGTVIFVVEIRGKEVFRSDVRRGSDKPLSVKVNLNGTSEFILRVLDGGDGPEFDEADWADSSVTLEDGRKIWLDEFSVVLAPARFSLGIPFSFVYDGKPSSELLRHWKRSDSGSQLPDGRKRQQVTLTDPLTKLEVTCESTVFKDFPAVDWVVVLRNTGLMDTPLIENIRAMDLEVTTSPGGDIVLHHSHGSTSSANDFLPIDEITAPNSEIVLAPVDGRSSDTTLPFFNLEWLGGGVVGAVGWSGQWSMRVHRGRDDELTLQAGQQTTHLKLHPGEAIRTPRMLLLAWRGGDPIRGHNLFRQLLLTHYLPRINGDVVLPPLTQNSWFTNSGNGVTEKNQLDIIRTAAEIGAECYWLDAGWFEGGWPNGAGSWIPRHDAFPNGLKPLSEAAHKKGMKFILWFEPERVSPGSRIAKEHPDWVMHVRPGEEHTPVQNLKENELFNLGDSKARQWLTELLSKSIEDWGIDVYRQDFNIFGALKFWQTADAPDRQGMAENLHVQGLYVMWDELLKRHPGLLIDNCASGGRRIDLEMLSRSLPLWRSDTQVLSKPMSSQDQVQTAGLSLYVPLHAAGVWSFDPYEWRSVATTGANLCMNHLSPSFNKEAAKRAIRETRELRPLWLGDYYPLTGINLDESQWIGWQFDRRDLGRGFAMYFRRSKSNYITIESSLRGLDPEAIYNINFADSGKIETLSGKDLARMMVTIPKARESLLITYVKKP
jgi:alpha-galactosidase